MKMSSFLLMLGLGCMVLYVLLNMFNLPIVEGKDEGISDEQNKELMKQKLKRIK